MSDGISDEKSVKRVTVDNQTTERHSLKDQIDYEKWENEKKAGANSKVGGIRFLKGINPGTV